MNNFDIFLCYRQQDAAPHAWMLFRDLTAAGYRVYFAPEYPGVPEWEPILQTCRDVLLLLSHDALGPDLSRPSDPLRRTLEQARGKNLIGITLTGFGGFPAVLPAGLEALPRIRCLSAEGTEYDDMIRRLLTGSFLASSAEHAPSLRPAAVQLPELEQQLAAFAAHPETDRTVILTDRQQHTLDLTLHRMPRDSAPELLRFQTAVVSRIPHGAEQNLFESLTPAEYDLSLEKGLCIGAYHSGRLAGLLVLLPHPTPEQNLLLDLKDFRRIDPSEVLVVDAVLVSGDCRGFGLQRTFNRLADCFSRELGIRYECTVVSPLNLYSLSNTIRSGFRFIGNFKKYHSTRNFFVKAL